MMAFRLRRRTSADPESIRGDSPIDLSTSLESARSPAAHQNPGIRELLARYPGESSGGEFGRARIVPEEPGFAEGHAADCENDPRTFPGHVDHSVAAPEAKALQFRTELAK